MWEALRRKNLGVRIMLGVIVGMLGVGMLLYLIPGQGTTGAATVDVVAQVEDAPITITDVRVQLARIERNGGAIPPALQALYAQQILGQIVFEKSLQVEGQRLGIRVTDEERAERIRLLIPTAFIDGAFVGIVPYTELVLARANMTVPEFEAFVSNSLLEEKFRQLVTDGVTLSPRDIEQEFRRRNEKVKLQYVLVNPDELQATIQPSDVELQGYFEMNKARYAVPERRVVRYAFLNIGQVRSGVSVSEDELRAAYSANLNRYKIEDRAHVAHILFKTVGKTDAEIEEIRKNADDVLKKAKNGTDFGALARQYSEDTSKDKGGDLDWIVRDQTVPEFEKMAFSLPKNAVSDVVKTMYGFHIIKVLDREMARTRTLDEVRASVLTEVQQSKTDQIASDLAGQIADQIRRSGRIPIDEIARTHKLLVEDTQPLEAGEPILQVGNAPEIPETIFRLRAGDLSAPIRTDLGFVVLSVKEIQPAHPGTLPEVHEMVLSDYRRDKAAELAKSRAEELGRRVKAGADITATAKSLGLETKTSDLFARTGSAPELGSAAQVAGAFDIPVGKAGDPVFLGANWVVYRVVEHQPANPGDLDAQRQEISQQLLEERKGMAFEAFRSSLEERMRQEGKLRYNEANLKTLTTPS